MPNTSSVSAISAILAALFAGLGLHYSARNERRRWARETLVDLLATFLDDSFAASAAAAKIYSDLSESNEPETEPRRIIREAHDSQSAALMKLRLLTDRSVVEAALGVHAADHDLVALAIAVPRLNADEVRQAHRLVWDARQKFVAAGKRAIGVRGRLALTTSVRPQTDIAV
jgi:hypothetical protein